MSNPEIAAESLAAKGNEARQREDWLTSLNHWALFHALYPDRAEGYLHVGDALWRLRHFGAADDILLRGIARFPGNEDIVLNYAWASADRRSWAEAEKRFLAALERFPSSITGRFGAAMARRELGRLEEAEAVLLDAAPEDIDPASQHLLAALATALGKFDTAVERWQALLARQPDDPEAHIGFIGCLRAAGLAAEANQASETAFRRFPGNETLLRNMAEIAEIAEDWPLALRRWESFKTVFGSLPDGYLGAARALMRLGRLDDAEVVMTPVVRLFARNADVLTLFAEIASRAGRSNEAADRLRAARKLAPERPESMLGEAAALRDAGNTREADDLLAKTHQRFPADLEVACRYAQAPQYRQDWPEAIERWRAVVAKFPREARPRVALMRCLVEDGAFAAAEAMGAEGLSLSPGDLDLLVAQAEISTRKGDADLADARWTALIDRAPEFWQGVIGYARHLLKKGDLRKLIELLEGAAPRFRSVLSFNFERARIFGELRDWPRVLPIWAELWPRSGGNGGVRTEIDRIVAMARQDLELAAADAPDAPPPFVIPPALLRSAADESRERDGARALLMRFESLGDSCEFGAVQRRFGAEPLSLLRWTGTPPDRLAAAFRAGLKDVGEPEFTKLEVVNGEYITTDTRYRMFAHTFTMETAAPRDKFYVSQCRRMRFLRDKLLQDLTNAEKIFVYGSALLNDERIDALFDALRELGPRATLLCVRVADGGYPAGSVTRRREGLLVAGIRGFSTVDTAFAEWLRICAAAAEMTTEEPRQTA